MATTKKATKKAAVKKAVKKAAAPLASSTIERRTEVLRMSKKSGVSAKNCLRL